LFSCAASSQAQRNVRMMGYSCHFEAIRMKQAINLAEQVEPVQWQL